MNRDASPSLDDAQPGENSGGSQPVPDGGGTAPVTRGWKFHAGLLLCYLAAGVAVSWPRPDYLTGRLPATIDQSSYVWDFWWVAHQILHFGNPWYTAQMAAPVGMPLGFDTLMPLPAALMTPVTLAFGPSVSYNLLTIIVPGLACYLAYRAARLWLTSEVAAIAAGAFYGLATMAVWQDWYHLNIALGALFLPLALEAAVRFRRRPGHRQAAVLGAVVGAALLVNQESAIQAAIVTAAALLLWLVRGKSWAAAREVLLAAAVFAVVASPQIIVMLAQATTGGTNFAPGVLTHSDIGYGVPVTSLFAPSPRLASYGLTPVSSAFFFRRVLEGAPTFGLALSVLAAIGLLAGWHRQRHTRLLAVGWLGSALIALGPSLKIGRNAGLLLFPVTRDGAKMSAILPYTWFTGIPGLDGFREADRFTLLGLLPAALLAGYAVQWLSRRWRAVAVVALAAAALEAGYSGSPLNPGGTVPGTVPTATPAVDAGIAADHSHSVVVDLPFGIHGGVGTYGWTPSTQTLVMATADGHPRADSDTSWVTPSEAAAVAAHPFYRDLVDAEYHAPHFTAAQLLAASADAHRMDMGWAVSWIYDANSVRYLLDTGFTFAYRAGDVRVYRLTAPAQP